MSSLPRTVYIQFHIPVTPAALTEQSLSPRPDRICCPTRWTQWTLPTCSFTTVRDCKILNFPNPGTPCAALPPFPGVCVLHWCFYPNLTPNPSVCIWVLLCVPLLRGHPSPAVTQTEAAGSPQHSWNRCVSTSTPHGAPASVNNTGMSCQEQRLAKEFLPKGRG